MPKILTEARSVCPELIDAVRELDNLAYTHRYDALFADLIDWMVWQHIFRPNEDDPLKKYSEQEQQHFLSIFKAIQKEIKKRVRLWTGYNTDGWYDPLGRIYECITSGYKSSMLGQYFIPEPVVDMMTRIIINPEEPEKVKTILDPACGSGRMGLAAADHAMKQGLPVWVTMNDIDPICSKMTAVNMALNGIVGEVLCMNGLDITGDSFSFGYRIEPAIAQYPPEMVEYYRILIMMKTQQDIKKQYVIKPVPYEGTFMEKVNSHLQEEYQERQKIADQKQREVALAELKDQVKARMIGTLFEGDESQLENVVLPSEQKERKPKKKNNLSTRGEQGELF